MHETIPIDVVVKNALTPTEHEGIRALLTACDEQEQLHTRQLLRLLRMYPTNEQNNFLAYLDGMLVGYAALSEYGTDERDLLAVVHPQHRRQGIFRTLFNAVAIACQHRQIERVVLPCEHHAQAALACMAALAIPFFYAEHAMTLGEFRERPSLGIPIVLQAANTNDAALISTLMADGSMPLEAIQELVTHSQQKPNECFYLGVLDHKPIGTLRLIQMEERVGIYSFVMHPTYRGHGYGRQMLQEAIHLARQQEHQEITLEVDVTNTNAIGLYRSSGFEITTTYDYYVYELPANP